MRQCLRRSIGVGLSKTEHTTRPRIIRSTSWPHLKSSIYSSSRWRSDNFLKALRSNLLSPYAEGLARHAAEERAAKEEFENSLPKFTYKDSLSPGQFRLLEIYRRRFEIAHPHEDYTLEGTMYVASLDDKTIKYKALSYVWGDAAESESIYIDGTLKKITKNCASALRCLLGQSAAVRIWVDSICINQGSDVVALTERGEQVRVMDEIYGHALEVFVYLGEGTAATRAMFRALRIVLTALGELGEASTDDQYLVKLGEYIKAVQEQTCKHGSLCWVKLPRD